jgi:hypothetical protein
MFVDHAGDTIDILHPATGEARPAYIFVAVLGASNYTNAEATWTQDLTDWIGSHTRALQFFQGATKLVVPDQWRAGVSRPCYWKPELNRTYQDWAMHVVPARPSLAVRLSISSCSSCRRKLGSARCLSAGIDLPGSDLGHERRAGAPHQVRVSNAPQPALPDFQVGRTFQAFPNRCPRRESAQDERRDATTG